MHHYQKKITKYSIILFCLLSLGGCIVHTTRNGLTDMQAVNRAIVVSAESEQGQDIRNINGRISVGGGMSVNNVSSVNGRIEIERDATASSVQGVNGRVELRENTSIEGDVHTVNGRINAVRGGSIGGNASSVNGHIRLTDFSVGNNVETTNGSINLIAVKVGHNVESRGGDITIESSVIERDVIIHKKRRNNLLWMPLWRIGKSEIVIGPNSEIKGNLIAREDIDLFVHESAKIGSIVGADPIFFSGRRK